jgi:hypothetical protein
MQSHGENSQIDARVLSDQELEEVTGGAPKKSDGNNPLVDKLLDKVADKIVELTEKVVNEVVDRVSNRPFLHPGPGSR